MSHDDRHGTRIPRTSDDLLAARTDALAALFPEAVSEGRIDFDALRRALGDAVDDRRERYGLTWPGKAEAIRAAQQGTTATLRPDRSTSIDFDATENVFIEGDNLEVLRLLQKAYAGTVKLIYIDPPYNTGQEFIYSDNYRRPLRDYLAGSGQVDDGGRRASSTTDAAGRVHSAWLSMMLPRLHLARNLLREDGVILVSIDRHELQNLLHLLDEVFGPENFIDIFTWVRTANPAALARKSKKVVEYVVCYEHTKNALAYRGIEKPVQSTNPLLNRPNAVRELVFPPGAIQTRIPDQTLPAGTYGTARYTVELLEDAVITDGRFTSPVRLRGRFRWSQPYLEAQIEAGVRILIATSRLIPSYEKDTYGREAPPNLIDGKVGVGTNEQASRELRRRLAPLQDPALDRMHPKPTSLLKYLIDAVCEDDALVMDFFAGSGTTGDAVMQLNAEQGAHRRFLLVQLPEPTKSPTLHTISAITRARLHAASQALQDTGRSPTPGAAPPLDVGLRCYTLAASNFQIWPPSPGRPPGLAQQLEAHAASLRPDAAPEDVLTEILLKAGHPLTTPVQTRVLESGTLYSLDGGRTLLCLDDPIAPATLRAMMEAAPHMAICLDQAFGGDDMLLANTVLEMKARGIAHFRTV